METRSQHIRKILLILICLVLIGFMPVVREVHAAQSGPITKIDLGVTELNLSVGESYTFDVRYEPEDTVLTTLDWQVTDESIITVDSLTNTVTALANGEARIFAESFDGFSYAVCTVTVGDSAAKDVSVMKSGGDFMDLSPEDLNKITAETLIRYLDFIADSTLDESSYENVTNRCFDLLGAVKPGTEQEQSQLAKDCGVEESVPLSELHAITLTGNLGAILKYAQNNPDLNEIFELGPFFLEEPVYDELDPETVSKAVTLEGFTKELTNIGFAQDTLGLDGKGRWIAVIDTGTDTSNAQFAGKRQIIEKCFSGSSEMGNYRIQSVCVTDKEGKGAAAPGNAWNRSKFDHGTHVAGIAVGTGGIAPKANLIAIQAFTEKVWTCKDDDERNYYACGADHAGLCCKSSLRNKEIGQAYDYLLNLAKTKNIQIDALNMSYGGGKEYAAACDDINPFEKKYFDQMLDLGIVPIVAAGNNYYNNGLSDAACLSNTYSVGALLDRADPVYAKFSNTGPNLDIAAPGSDIFSAGYTKPMMKMSGTSMAAPMVSGAVALVKQIYPGMKPKNVEFYLKSISTKIVNQKPEHSFGYNKPVLTFDNMLKLIVPYYDWITGGDHSITIKVDRMSRQAKFTATVTDLNNDPVNGLKVQWKSDGDYTYVKISGNNLQNGTVYKVNLTRTVKIGGKTYESSTTEFGRPRKNTVKPTATPANGMVYVKSQSGNVRYLFYEANTGKFVAAFNVDDGSKSFKVTGFVNGRPYSVSVVPYEVVKVNGQDVNFYGSESARVNFMPMSEPFNAKVTYPSKKNAAVTVSCTADKAADGIIVKVGSNGKWTNGCQSKGNKFTCSIKSVGTNQDFRIVKYKVYKGKTYESPAVIVKGKK